MKISDFAHMAVRPKVAGNKSSVRRSKSSVRTSTCKRQEELLDYGADEGICDEKLSENLDWISEMLSHIKI